MNGDAPNTIDASIIPDKIEKNNKKRTSEEAGIQAIEKTPNKKVRLNENKLITIREEDIEMNSSHNSDQKMDDSMP